MIYVLCALLGLVLLAMLAACLYFVASPMPIVRLLRKGGDAPATWPEDLEPCREKVLVENDRTYPSRAGHNRFDLYLPRQGGGLFPVIVWVHGGAFVAGGKSGVANWAACLAAQGFAVAAMDYQWAPEARWPAQVAQIGECCQCLAGLAAEKRLDMSRVVLAGDSAGAHMAAQFALAHSSEGFQASTGLGPVLPAGTLKAALLYCGPYDIGLMARPQSRFMRLAMHRIGWSYFGKRNWQNSPAAKASVIKAFVSPAFPPTYITDGNAHSFEGQGRALAEALQAQGVPVETRFFGSEQGEVTHEYQFDLARPEARACYEDTLAFLKSGVLYRVP